MIESYVEAFEQLFPYHVECVYSDDDKEEWNWVDGKFIRVR